MSRYRFEQGGETWWVGYDVQDATFFLDRDTDLDLDEYMPAPMRTFGQLVERSSVPIPDALLDRLRGEDPRSPLAAEAAATARLDQVSASLRASFPSAPASRGSTLDGPGTQSPRSPGKQNGMEL